VADFEAVMDWEKRNSRVLGGRTVFDHEEKPPKKSPQGSLF
jgi:hypothetical protein